MTAATGRTAVLGFGNPVRNDDGIGPWVIGALRERLAGAPGVTLFDMGTSAFDALFALRGHDRFVIVDAVTNSGEPAGTLFELPAEAIAAQPEADPLVFLHGLKWTQALAYAKRLLGPEYPTDIRVLLVAVDDLGWEMTLSPAVADAGARLVDRIAEDLCVASP